MIDGWVWNVFRGQVVGAGTFAGQPIDLTPPDAFVARDATLGRPAPVRLDRYARATTWRAAGASPSAGAAGAGRTSSSPIPNSLGRDVDAAAARCEHLDFLGAEVALVDARGRRPGRRARELLPRVARVRRTTAEVPLSSAEGQLAFRAPRDGSYVVRLEYPRYAWLSAMALTALLTGAIVLRRLARLRSRPFDYWPDCSRDPRAPLPASNLPQHSPAGRPTPQRIGRDSPSASVGVDAKRCALVMIRSSSAM